MYREIFTSYEPSGGSHRTKGWIEQLWVLGLLLAAIVLYQMNLGELPLRDWDEGIVAQVARDIWRGDLNWLHPTIAGEPYFNKPPLVHLLVAIAYHFGGVNEWTTRLPGAMLSAISVPLLYGIAREVFPLRGPAIFSALIYLTLFPVVRHGRLAMLDGALLCFFLLTLWCLLRSRRDLRWGLGVGFGLGAIVLTKGVVAILLGTIALLFTLWDTPRLLRSGYLWTGLLLGMTPVTLWYVAQLLYYGDRFASAHFLSQSWQRLLAPVENNSGPPWFYLLELLKYTWPWLLFWPAGFHLAWNNRSLGWAKLVLVWTGIYLSAITVMSTKLPWYVLPVYPAIALTCGAVLAQVWQGDVYAHSTVPSTASGPLSPSHFYPRYWVVILGILALGAWGASAYFGLFDPSVDPVLPIALFALALTFSVSASLVYREDRQFVLILFWGMYVSLCLFVSCAHWVWELAEDYPVRPVAQIVREYTPPEQVVYTSHPYHRPSLNFYSDRQVIPADLEQLQQHWKQDDRPYLLLDPETRDRLQLKQAKAIAEAENWILIARDPTKGLGSWELRIETEIH
jgi:4-amino-4-deoxy-L-arabinose transferase-like glycosyltransferase